MRLTFLFLLFLFSCSSSVNIDIKNIVKKNGLKLISNDKKIVSKIKNEKLKLKFKKKSIKYNLGPSKKNSKVFIDLTKAYGLTNVNGTAFYAVDFNGDLKTDLVYLPSPYSSPIFLERKKKKFIRLKYNPFKNIPRASYLIFHDFNKDNLLDLLVATFNQHASIKQEPIKIFKATKLNNKIKYILQKNDLGKINYPVSSIALLDYDLDGKVDIFLGNWFASQKVGKQRTPNRIFKGLGKFLFKDASYLLPKEVDYSSKYKDYINAGPTMGVSICDIDQNGYPDILTANSSGFNNKLWINQIDKKNNDRVFKDFGKKCSYNADSVGTFGRRGGGNSYFSLCGDYNNDGIIDIAIGELYHSYDGEERDRSSILTGSTFNFPPQFIRSEYYKDDGSGYWNEGDKRGLWFDYNMDGLKDLLIDNSGFPPNSRLIFFEQEKNHGFNDIASKVGIDILNPIGSISLDFNNDGKLDLLTGQTSLRLGDHKTNMFLFQNKSKWRGNRSIRFFLRGKKSNTDAIGASLYLKTTSGVYSSLVQYNFGPQASQIEEGQWFGIPNNSKLKEIEVRWPYNNGMSLLSKTYNLSSFNFKYHVDVTLCEDGRFKYGRKYCH